MGMRASVEQVSVSSGNVTVHEGILVFFFQRIHSARDFGRRKQVKVTAVVLIFKYFSYLFEKALQQKGLTS